MGEVSYTLYQQIRGYLSEKRDMGILFHIGGRYEKEICQPIHQFGIQFHTWAKSYYTLIQLWFRCLPPVSLTKITDFSVLCRVTHKYPESPTQFDNLFGNKGWVVGSAERQGDTPDEVEVKVSLTVTGIVFGSEK